MGVEGSLSSFRRDPWLFSLWILGPICTSVYALILGRHDGADYLNVRWFLGWLLVNDIDGAPSDLRSLTVRPFLNELFVGLLSEIGFWWLPVLVVGALHGAIPALLYEVCRSLSSRVSPSVAALASSISLTTPLVSVHIGRENGHLLAALCIVLALRQAVAQLNKRSLILAAFFLNFALFLKYSSVFTVAVVAVFILVTVSPKDAARFARSMVAILWVFTLIHSSLRWPSLTSKEIALQHIYMGSGSFYFLGLVIVASYWVTSRQGVWMPSGFRRIRIPSRRFSPLLLPTLVFGLLAFSSFAQLSEDERFYTKSVNTMLRRVTSNGLTPAENQYGPESLFDLEYRYFDVSKIVAMLVLLFALVGLIANIRNQRVNRSQVFLFCSIPGFTLLIVMAYYGYVRYAVEGLLLVPVAVVGFVCTLRIGVKARATGLALPLLLLVLPLSGFREWQGYFDIDPDTRMGPLLSDLEVGVLSGLVPSDTAILLLDRNVSWVVPAMDRRDLEWWIDPVTPNDLGETFGTLFFDPSRNEKLEELAEMGWFLRDCQVLRFERISIGWCSIMDADISSLA